MALGKRKEREEEERHGSTLFVSNLPYNTTSTDLQTLFSDIAPVRNAFVVCEFGTGVSKGVGYVSFAMREDAQLAFDKINTEGLTLVGRKLRIQWAETKVKKDRSDTNDQKKPSQKVQPQPRINRISQDPLAIRTVIISGLSPSIDSKSLWKKIRKYQGAEKIEWPVLGGDGVEDSSSAHALFSTPALALDAVNKLHAHVFKGSLLSVTLKKRLDILVSHKAPSANLRTTPSHAHRLIIRNIPFSATAQDLRSIFLPYGPIHSIDVPLKEPVSPKSELAKAQKDEAQHDGGVLQTRPERNKGFAFVWFYSRKDAEKAMQERNGTVLRAGVAEELVKGKQKKKKERRMELKLAKGKAEVPVTEDNDSDEDDAAAEANNTGKDKNERIMAVDWALSKDRWEEEKAKIEQVMADEDGNDDDVQSRSDQEESEGEQGGLGIHDHEDSDEESGNESGSDQSEQDGEEEERNQDDKPVKPHLPQTDVGTTLFIRNIPYDATEDELRTLFRAFGPLRYARITMDHAIGRSRGTGFACFWNKEDADKVIEQSELLRAETTGNTMTVPKNNPFTLPSILTPDPSASLAQNLVLHGRALDVIRAVTRDEAGRLKEMGERAREKADKRNMYLLREGVILPNSPSATHVSPTDLERRTNSFNSRRALLKSNPSLYISKTRLSVRQIPLYVTERMLKQLAAYAVRAFEKEVKTGKRDRLSEDELRDPAGQSGAEKEEKHRRADASEAGNESDASSAPSTATTMSKSGKRKAKQLQKLVWTRHKGNSGVKQAKIVRQADRVDAITGKGRSRGYGFIEMSTHADALRVLRWANGNSDVDGLLRTWWKEDLERLIKVERDKQKKVAKGKVGEGGEEEEQTDARLKRMVAELEKEKLRKDEGNKEDGGTSEARSKSRGTLIVEFSIENVQVVQRRNAVQKNRAKHETEEASSKGEKMLDDGRSNKPESEPCRTKKNQKEKAKRPRDGGDGDGEADKGNPRKKRRVSAPPNPAREDKGDSNEVPPQTKKLGQTIGSIIGRKRKERRKVK